jgi:hypothetical protein
MKKTIELKKLSAADQRTEALVADLEKLAASSSARWTDSFAAGEKVGDKRGDKPR